MNVENRITQVLTMKLGFYVPTNEIEHETLWLFKDELDPLIADKSIIHQLDETVIAHSASYEAEDGTYYLLLQVLLKDNTFHEVWLVNDQVVPDFTKKENG